MPEKARKLRLLAWNDSPLSITGFGVVAKNILGRIYNTGVFDIACIGINHFDEHADKLFESRSDVPYKVTIGADMVGDPTKGLQVRDRMGRGKLCQLIRKGNIDALFLMRDLWDMVVPGGAFETYIPLHIQLAKEQGHNFRVISHFPLEYQIQQPWTNILDQIDYGYCFTQGGMHQLRPWEDNIKWCPQGADSKIYKPLKNFNRQKFRQEKMRLEDPNVFVVLNVNRNQPRKDVEATIQAFRLFKQQSMGSTGPRPVLWLHMRPDDNYGDARKLVEDAGLRVDYDVCFPPYFNVGVGWTEEELNMLYNSVDLFISTSVAEGFGLTPVEAGMAGCPVLVPGHTGFLQTMGELGMPYIRTRAPEIRRQVAESAVHPTDIDDMARNIMNHYMNPKILRDKVRENWKTFRNKFDWDAIFRDYWEPLLETVEADVRGAAARQHANAKRFLFVCEEAFGDIIGATKAIDALKKARPDVPIDFMAKRRFNDVITGNPNVERNLDWSLNRLFDYPRDRVFYPHARIRHGSWSNGVSHLLDMQSNMIGLQPGEAYLMPDEFDTLISDVTDKYKYITINTTSQGGKMIDANKWGAIIRGVLSQNPEIRFLLVGGPGDMMVPGAIDFRFEPGVDPPIPLSYRKMAWLQKYAFCHVGIDSGPAHSASTMDTPSIVFWGWTNMTVCKPEKHAINIVPNYETVCPRMGPCHGVEASKHCGVNQYQRESAMNAPCVRSLDVTAAIVLINKALDKGYEEGREWLKKQSKKLKPIYALPINPHVQEQPNGG